MAATILDAKPIATRLGRQIREDLVAIRRELKGEEPAIGVLLVTGDQVSMAFVDKLARDAESFGIAMTIERMAERKAETDLVPRLTQLVSRPDIHGILVSQAQLDRPDFDQLVAVIPGKADLSGLHYANIGHLGLGKTAMLPPRVRAAWELVLEYVDDYRHRGVVIVSSRNDGVRGFLGRALALHCANLGIPATVRLPLTHQGAQQGSQVQFYNPSDEILISFANTMGALTKQNVKHGSIVIDAGYNFHLKRVSGDANFLELQSQVAMISPVPGGVESLAPLCVLKNFIELLNRQFRFEPEESAIGLKARRRL